MVHITQNSILRMAGLAPQLGLDNYHYHACGIDHPRGRYLDYRTHGSYVILPEDNRLEALASVTCTDCRVLADAAMEQREDIMKLMEAMWRR
jgi:hypothetical protein